MSIQTYSNLQIVLPHEIPVPLPWISMKPPFSCDPMVRSHGPHGSHGSHGSHGLFTDFLVLFGHLLLYLPRRCLMQFFDQVAWCLDPKKWGKVMKSQDFSALETSLECLCRKCLGLLTHLRLLLARCCACSIRKPFSTISIRQKKGGNKHNKPSVNLLNLWPSLTTDYLPPPKKRSTAMKAYLLHCLLHGYNFPLLIVHHLTRWGSGQGIHHGSATNQWLHVATTNKKDILSGKRKCQGFSNLTLSLCPEGVEMGKCQK